MTNDYQEYLVKIIQAAKDAVMNGISITRDEKGTILAFTRRLLYTSYQDGAIGYGMYLAMLEYLED